MTDIQPTEVEREDERRKSPAKVSEDVERDILTIDRCIRYPEHFPSIAIEASAALDRLVSRIKEGTRG